MFDSISNLISSGTGVNSAQLVADLLAATREPKEAVLQRRENANNLKISALASAASSLDTFAAALSALLDGRAFAGDLTSSQPSLASVNFIDGTRPQGLPATLKINQIASARRLASQPVTDSNVSVGPGTMTITNGGQSFDVILTAGTDSLADLAAAINGAASGISASVITDNAGARLVLEGPVGGDQTFEVSGDFTDFNYPPGGTMTLMSEAADALINIDGLDLRYGSNLIENAIPGVSINLNAASPGTAIHISGDRPTSTVADLVSEFVDAYNQLRTALNDATAAGASSDTSGPLAGDAGIREMLRSLGQINTATLASSGPYRTLSDIGVKTNRDGTLSIDKVRLDAVLANDSDAVSNMLDPLVKDASNPGISGVLQAIRDRLQDENGALETSKKRLDKIKENLASAWTKLNEDSEQYEIQLRRSFATMDRQLVLLNATQSYLTQQIAIWNNSDN
ncbi:MAG: flagellar filament capping protein FliD [Parasphingorhabdus sp.]|uniref:flagellar filament capping protein FliD n=1 Tax=Parasphingorhabdus sp. TaxID=2709688 RepID=UPI0030018DF9